MPPQPLSKVKPDASLHFDPGALRHFPEFAKLIGQQIATWGYIDSFFTRMASNFLESDFEVVAAMLGAIASSKGKTGAIQAAAKHALPKDGYQLFSAALKVIKPSRDRRNAFAHHLWARSDDLPDRMLLIDPSALAQHTAAWTAHLKLKPGELMQKMPRAYRDNAYVYRLTDVEESLEQAKDAFNLVGPLLMALDYDSPGSQSWRAELSKKPSIQQALQKASGKNGQ